MASTASPDKPSAITCAPCCGAYRSRTIARAQTTLAATAAPCATRHAISVPMLAASAAPRLAATNSARLASSTGRRP